MDAKQTFSNTLKGAFSSDKAGGVTLILCTVLSIALANSFIGQWYKSVWATYVGPLSIEHWINDGLMAIFFLTVGLELKREFISGELSNVRQAMLPVLAAFGGVIVPAGIHFSLNYGTSFQAGTGIPMATDIAFALGVLALLGDRVPGSLKIFLTALAIIDDLAAILVIGLFYSTEFSAWYLFGAFAIFGGLILLNKVFGVRHLGIFLVFGVLMWILMLKSGIHATIAGVLLAFTIPSSKTKGEEISRAKYLEQKLHLPVVFLILPIFALANTGIIFSSDMLPMLTNSNGLGICLGLVVGKPVGIFLVTCLALKANICRLPSDLDLRHIFGAGLLGGIGFTMSIFITNLAFPGEAAVINSSTLVILIASLSAGIIGLIWLRIFGQTNSAE